MAKERHIPWTVNTGAAMGLLGGLLAACGSDASLPENPTETSTLEPIATTTFIPELTATEVIDLIENFDPISVSESLKGSINSVLNEVPETPNYDVQNAKNNFQLAVDQIILAEDDSSWINSVVNNLGYSGDLITDFACNDPNNIRLVQARNELKNFLFNYVTLKNSAGLFPGDAEEITKRYFRMPPDCSLSST